MAAIIYKFGHISASDHFFFKYAIPMFSRASNLMKVLTKCYEEQ